MGIETEFGCLVVDETLGNPEHAVEAIKDYVFHEQRLGVIDLHSRDEVFEPAHSGGFLMNGARLYVDAVGSHLEYATAECRNLRDLIANDRAGQRIIVQALHELGLDDVISVYNNSVDHFGGHTFGCHENYLTLMDEDFFGEPAHGLYPFLVTRQIYAGVGRVGGHILSNNAKPPSREAQMANPVDYIWVSNVYGVYPDHRVDFQLSQRSDHILKTAASRVRFNRAMINPKWEHYYQHEERQRLHLLFGESNQNEFAYALKVGTTLLALCLVEDEMIPDDLRLANPIRALRDVSRDSTYQWEVTLVNGEVLGAVNLQRRYLELAEGYRGQHPDIDWTLDAWATILDDLERDPLSLGDRLDWVAKRNMIDQYRTEEGLAWSDDALHSVDLEYHNIDPEKSLFHALQEMGETHRFVDDVAIIDAMVDPPKDTRAFGRGGLVREVLTGKKRKFYVFDWNAAIMGRHDFRDLSDPFNPYSELLRSVSPTEVNTSSDLEED